MGTEANTGKVTDHAFLDACKCRPTTITPVWLMRQAGRYLSEYREIREKYSFIEMCKTPDVAVEVTLQPVELLGVDAAIIFADIMLPLEGMGVDFEFSEGGGPVIRSPVGSTQDVQKLRVAQAQEAVPYLLEAIKSARERLRDRVPLIGFSGAPFTLASYLIEGGQSRNWLATKKFMYTEPSAWHSLMEKLTDTLVSCLKEQAKAGAQALQVFDSWVGCLSPLDYDRFVMPHSKRLFDSIKDLDAPAIHFGTDTATLIERIRDAGGDVIGVDWRIPIDEARERIGYDRAIQGNLDPAVLFAPLDIIREKVLDILNRAGSRPGHIFNLGHGVLPGTPPDNVKAMIDMVHEINSRETG